MRSRFLCLTAFLLLVASLGAWCEEANKTPDKNKEDHPLSQARRLMQKKPDPTTNLNGPQKGYSAGTVVIPAYVPAHDTGFSHHRRGYDQYEYQYYSQWWYYYQSNPYGGYAPEVQFTRDMGDAMVARDFDRDYGHARGRRADNGAGIPSG